MAIVCRGVAGLLVTVALAGAPVAAWAQAGWYVTPRFSISEEYNDNITFQVNGISDFITRFTPGFVIGYRSEPLTFGLSYDTSFEVYAENSNLNNIGDNQRGVLIARYAPNRRLSLGLASSFFRSLNTPGRIATQPPPGQQGTAPAPAPAPSDSTSPAAPAPTDGSAVGPGDQVVFFDVGRQQVQSFSVTPQLSYELDPLTSLGASYTFIYLDVEDEPTQTSQSAGLTLNRVMTQRLTGNAVYSFKLFESNDPEGDGTFTSTSNALTVGGRYQLTDRASVHARAGPNYISTAEDSSVTLEASAGVSYTLRQGFLSLDYRRTQALVVGVTGAQTVNTLVGQFSYQLTRDIGMYVTPSATFNAREETEDLYLYEIAVGFSYQLTRWLSASARYLFSLQLEGSNQVTQNSFTVGLNFSDTYRLY